MKHELRQLARQDSPLNPEEVWVRKARQGMLDRLVVTSDSSRVGQRNDMRVFFDVFFRGGRVIYPFVRPVFVSVLAMIVTVGGWIAGVSASYNSGLLDTLYSVKLATEKIQIAFAVVTGDSEDQTRLNSEFAVRRAQEVNQVAQKKEGSESKKSTQKATALLKESLASASEGVKDQKDPSKATILVKDLQEKTQIIVDNLKEAGDTNTMLREDLQGVKKDVVDVATKTITEVAKNVLKQQEGLESGNKTLDQSVKDVKQVAKNTIDAMIQVVNDDIGNTKADTAVAKTIAQATSTLAIVPFQTPSSTILVGTSAVTNTILGSVSAVAALTKAEKTLEQADQIASELADTKTLVDQDVVGALEQANAKANSASQVTQQAQQVVSVVKQNTGAKSDTATTTLGIPVISNSETSGATTTQGNVVPSGSGVKSPS